MYDLTKKLIDFQKNELLSSLLYLELSKKSINNNEIFKRLSEQERKHYKLFYLLTKKEIKLGFFDKVKLKFYLFLFYILGPLFTVKFLEKSEEEDIKNYKNLLANTEDQKLKKILNTIIKDEMEHEKELIELIKDSKVANLDSIVLGMNDALVELTGALMGLAGLLNNNLKIAFSGLITGIAASLSMAASSYLSKKAETNNTKKALISSFYTGVAYIFTTLLLVSPFFILSNKYVASAFTLLNVLVIILLYSWYYSIVKDSNFFKEFMTMAFISIGVSILSFILGKISDYLFF